MLMFCILYLAIGDEIKDLNYLERERIVDVVTTEKEYFIVGLLIIRKRNGTFFNFGDRFLIIFENSSIILYFLVIVKYSIEYIH